MLALVATSDYVQNSYGICEFLLKRNNSYVLLQYCKTTGPRAFSNWSTLASTPCSDMKILSQLPQEISRACLCQQLYLVRNKCREDVEKQAIPVKSGNCLAYAGTDCSIFVFIFAFLICTLLQPFFVSIIEQH